ncbi:hypothetical protein COCSUDRAFT_59788 [Coccomyxa subellipsoidea C-169]|uniref:Uncharacterized protein n=1 Tax=Coccomyxa subellipsoidea (strain C-169) TaxID=574566 RepID=I0YKE1_COCSC|nr:hypothetical protein COCSUDRAFT_59788 [Coccomyxa subellipsoidea C-169]EIE18860.1 hypothetical protein COCSUDRAFT_59788 [Coccomyxa subellipsoidea C-169]|eukprot:XP_005643404.1 hypothetical protein COCSUDRAFT_59788 [Coccomyxa subellipsoidea C-169]
MDSGEEVHSVSEPLPAYLLPQEPYFSVVKSILRPPLGPKLQDAQLLHLWDYLPDKDSGFPDGFPEAFKLAHQAAIWGVPSVQVATAFTKSALNKTSPFPTLSINAVVNYADPLDGTRQPQARSST